MPAQRPAGILAARTLQLFERGDLSRQRARRDRVWTSEPDVARPRAARKVTVDRADCHLACVGRLTRPAVRARPASWHHESRARPLEDRHIALRLAIR